MFLKRAVKNLVYRQYASSERYIAYLRAKGMRIGEHTVIYSPRNCVIDETRPWMIEIGNNVSITTGVTILTHGYDWSVLKGLYGDVLGSAGHVFIGDNVFIGMHSTILKGVTIGDNVIIGANTLINKDVPNNCVVVGNPQRIVCDIDSYLEKRQSAQLDEALDLYTCWRKNSIDASLKKVPPQTLFREFFWLFSERGELHDVEFSQVMQLCGSEELSWARFVSTEPMFDSYASFLAYLDSRVQRV